MYKIATVEMAVVAIRNVFAKHRTITSQRLLKSLVDKEMEEGGEPYKIAEKRLRLLTLDNGIATVLIEYRESETKRAISMCPVCGERLKRARNMTVFGGTVTLGYNCPSCGYNTGARRRVPVKYTFIRRK